MCLLTTTLPYQWRQQAQDDGVGEPDQRAPAFHFFAPLQLAAGLPTRMQPFRWWLRDTALGALVAIPLAASIVYPMDWGEEYQTWPVPTLYTFLGTFCVCQAAEVVAGGGPSFPHSSHKSE